MVVLREGVPEGAAALSQHLESGSHFPSAGPDTWLDATTKILLFSFFLSFLVYLRRIPNSFIGKIILPAVHTNTHKISNNVPDFSFF